MWREGNTSDLRHVHTLTGEAAPLDAGVDSGKHERERIQFQELDFLDYRQLFAPTRRPRTERTGEELDAHRSEHRPAQTHKGGAWHTPVE